MDLLKSARSGNMSQDDLKLLKDSMLPNKINVEPVIV